MEINYSDRYQDGQHVYRHIQFMDLSELQDIQDKYPNLTDRLFTEKEWRKLGIEMSVGWIHYGYYPLNPAVWLFRRPITY